MAENIRAAVASKGMPIDTLADLAGLSRSYLYAILGAQNAVTVDKRASIADALGIHVAGLVKKRWRALRPDPG